MQILNVIVGSNNSGKTGLLYAINLLSNPADISVDDFNKNNLLKYSKLYIDAAPSVTIEYNISHRICEDDTTDESIIRLLPFLGIKEFEENRQKKNESVLLKIIILGDTRTESVALKLSKKHQQKFLIFVL